MRAIDDEIAVRAVERETTTTGAAAAAAARGERCGGERRREEGRASRSERPCARDEWVRNA